MRARPAKSARRDTLHLVQSVHVLGDGCAGLSLAAQANALPHHRITVLPLKMLQGLKTMSGDFGGLKDWRQPPGWPVING